MQKTISRSFRLRMMALVMFGILPPLWGAIGYASYRAASIFRAEAQENMAVKADALSAEVEHWHTQNMLILDELSTEENFANMERQAQIPDMLSALHSDQSRVESVVTVDLSGEVVADVSTQPRPRGNYRNHMWFRSAAAGDEGSRVLLSLRKEDSTVAFSKPIVADPSHSASPTETSLHKDDSVEGVVMIEARLDQVQSAVETTQVGEHGFALVLDETGQILAHSNPKSGANSTLPTERSKESLPASTMAMATGEQTRPLRQSRSHLRSYLPATKNQASMLSTASFIPELLKKQTSALDFLDAQGNQWTAHREALVNGWSVVLLQPSAELSKEARLFQHLALITGAISFLITAVALSVLSAKLTNPILRLSNAATALSLGRFDQKLAVEKITVESKDEIGTLATAFNSVADQLQLSFRRLSDQNESLKQLDQLKDQFLANTSHELKTPLNGMIGIAESLLDGAVGPLTDPQRQNVAMIAASSHRLTRLVNDILDFSKLQHQQLPLRRKPLAISASVSIVIALSRALIGNKSISIENNITSDLPLVYADENRLQQILLNLVSNAVKFTFQGSVVVTAELIDEADASFVAVSVVDTGIGIEYDRLDDIFQPFQQLRTVSDYSGGGTGLGLSITQHLVDLHEGKIWVNSLPAQGSTFTFTLPVASAVADVSSSVSVAQLLPAEDGEKHTELSQLRSLRQRTKLSATWSKVFKSKEQPSPHPTLDPHKFNLLVVDDEPINVQVLNNHLSSENYTVTHALSGADALKLLTQKKTHCDAVHSQQTFDLVVLDVMMPQMSGYEVCQKLREIYPAHKLPVVMLTAKNQISDLMTGFHFGANDYMTKPFSKDELLTRIRAHLRLSKTNHSYGRFVPSEYLRFLKKESIVDVRLGDHVSKEMAVMFSDIRSFTSLSEQMTPQENFDFVNAYLRQVSPAVRDQNGFIVKYLGDGMMAVFPDSVDDAVAAGIAKLRSVDALNQDSKALSTPSESNKRQSINIGIGIHFGHMMVGMVGEAARMQGDAFSDNVNLTARLESLTKLYGVSMVISNQALANLSHPDRYQIHFLDRVVVKGRREPIDIYHVLDGEPAHTLTQLQQSRDMFDTGIAHYRSGAFDIARSCFEKILKILPNNKTARIYYDRLCELVAAPPEHWNGVWILNQK
ncbi:MAG: ATP-binding protein [Cyanobacteria bacterium P01_D01_bin.105]